MKFKNFFTSPKKLLVLICLILFSSISFAQSFTLEAKVIGTPRVSGDHLGHHGGNAIDGDYMVAGAHLVDTLGVGNCGAAFLYHWNDTTCVWEQIDKIYAETAIGVLDLEANADFGVSVALEGDIIAIGASLRNNSFTDAGRVYIYRIIGDEAVFVQVLNANRNDLTDDRESNAQYGTSLKLHGQRLIVGAPFESQNDALVTVTSAGAAYIYEWNAISELFEFQRKVTAPNRAVNDQFGNEVSIFGNHAVVAAQYEDNDELDAGFLANAGSAYVFELDDITYIWTFSHKLVAPDRTANDFFWYIS
jgi:hypothetical protein